MSIGAGLPVCKVGIRVLVGLQRQAPDIGINHAIIAEFHRGDAAKESPAGAG
jgi:hypothetical protein